MIRQQLALLQAASSGYGILFSHMKQESAAVAVLRPLGSWQLANYRAMLAAGCKAHEGGARRLIVDLSDVERLGTAGLVALHGLALLVGQHAAQSGQHNLIVVGPQQAVRARLLCTPQPLGLLICNELGDALESFLPSPVGKSP
jgi:anti-anti-sigma regulatory factor